MVKSSLRDFKGMFAHLKSQAAICHLSPMRRFGDSPYCFAHALVASTALGVLVFSGGFASFWRQFVYGLNQVMTPEVLKQNLFLSTAFFASLLFVLWLMARLPAFWRTHVPPPADERPSVDRLRAVRLAACVAPVLTAIALGLNWLGAHAITWCTGVQPADQELVKCFADGQYALGLRTLLVVVVLFQAPLLEEPIFRGIVFRGFASCLPFWGAALLSGAVFALVHVNAASFVALWFLGFAFAWLYARTGTILAPMTAHFLFNAANLLLLVFFPELSAN